MGKVALIRPDGTTLQATPEQAEKLKLLGYREEQLEERSSRIAEDAKEDYYSTPDQQVRAGGAALARGATMGVSDYLVGDEHTAARAKYNPGTSTAFEALGALAPLVVSGGGAGAAGIGRVAAATPTALMSRGAASLAGGIENRFVRSATTGLLEGAGYGAAQAANHTYLTGDPITAETILHGAKWGAVFGGGFGVAGEGLSVLGEKAGASIASAKAAKEAATPGPITPVAKAGSESYHALRTEITTVSDTLEEFSMAADALVSGTANKLIKLGESATIKHGKPGAVAAKQSDEAYKYVEPPVGDEFGEGVLGQARANNSRLAQQDMQAQGAMTSAQRARLAGNDATAQGAMTSAQRNAQRIATNDARSQGAMTSAQREAAAHRKATSQAQGAKTSDGDFSPGVKMDAPDGAPSGPVELSPPPQLTTGDLAVIRQQIQKAMKSARKAVNEGNAAMADKATIAFEAAVNSASEKLGVKLGNPATSFRELIEVKAATKALKSFPKTVEEFASMTPAKANNVFAALDRAKKLSAYPELSASVEQAATKLSESLGIKATGTEGLRNAWAASKEAIAIEKEAGRQARKAAAAEANVAEGKGGAISLGLVGNFALNRASTAIAGSALGGVAVGYGIRKLLSGETLAAMRNNAMNRIKEAAARYAPTGGKVIAKVGPRIEPLAMKLDGTFDNSTKNREDLAAARVKEFWQAYPTINDRLYRGVEAVGISQPELGPAVHAASVAAFKSMLATVPRDPGVVSGLKSLWKPSQLQAEVLSRRLEVFHDPIGQAETMLSTGNFDPIKIKTLKMVAPAVYAELRQGAIERIAQPGVMDKMSYNEQIGMGTMLDIPIHSSMRPEHIAASQQLFMVRNQPAPMPVVGGENKNGGRPSAAENENATRSQKITDR